MKNQLPSSSIHDILSRLEETPVNLAILKATMIAKVVNSRICKQKSGGAGYDSDLILRAKKLIGKWKAVAKASGVTSNNHKNKNSNVNSDSNSKMKSNESNKAQSEKSNDQVALKKRQSFESPSHAAQRNLPTLRRNIYGKIKDALCMVIEKQNNSSNADEAKKKSSTDKNTNGNNENNNGDESSAFNGMPDEVILELCESRAEEIESQMNSLTNFQTQKANYVQKARQLAFNLKKNNALREQVVFGYVQAEDLVKMSVEDLATSEAKHERKTLVEKLSDSRRLDWDQKNEGKINEICGIKGELLKASLFTCGRCKSTKTTSTQKQTRSADEPMTVFVWCMNCGNRWKC